MHRQIISRFKQAGLLAAVGLALAPALAQAQQDSFNIFRFQVDGNTLLTAEEVAAAVAPFAGLKRTYTDVQRALDALELRYRQAGYGAVLVHVPEQELTGGEVRLDIIEPRLRQITILYATPRDKEFFDEENIRRALPALTPGATPNTPAIAENIQLANENPVRQAEVILKAADRLGQIDAEVQVKAGAPQKLFVSLDNTGSVQTGHHRLGIGLQHANLLGRDHVATLNYTTSLEKPAQVGMFSLSYRVPLYGLGDSVDLIAARSDVDAGTTPTVAGPLSFTGKGDVLGLRYNYLLHRRGPYAQRLIVGIDYRAFDNSCNLAGFGAAGCGPSAVDVTVRPLSLSYAGQWQGLRQAVDFSLGYVHNWAGAKNGKEGDFAQARPAGSGVGGAPAGYALVRASGAYFSSGEGDWQVRLAGSAQYALDPLISGEQFGLAGSGSVRGFGEREAARDGGYVLNLEAYTPNLAQVLGWGTNLRALAFYDASGGQNRLLAGDALQKIHLASAGVGLRLSLDKRVQVKLDAASVIDGAGLRARGQLRGHFSLNYAY